MRCEQNTPLKLPRHVGRLLGSSFLCHTVSLSQPLTDDGGSERGQGNVNANENTVAT